MSDDKPTFHRCEITLILTWQILCKLTSLHFSWHDVRKSPFPHFLYFREVKNCINARGETPNLLILTNSLFHRELCQFASCCDHLFFVK